VTFTESDAEPLSTHAALTVGIAVGVDVDVDEADEADGVSELEALHPVRANARVARAAVVTIRMRRVGAIGTGSILPHRTLTAGVRRAGAARGPLPKALRLAA
jgi:hypothetical protein